MSSVDAALDAIAEALRFTFGMAWEVLWALILGFALSAAVQAVYDTLKALREGVAPRDLKNIAPPELMRRVTRADDYQQWTKDFLGGA